MNDGNLMSGDITGMDAGRGNNDMNSTPVQKTISDIEKNRSSGETKLFNKQDEP
jgi:hypothetical protein